MHRPHHNRASLAPGGLRMHHVLPLALPGILTGTLIGMAKAVKTGTGRGFLERTLGTTRVHLAVLAAMNFILAAVTGAAGKPHLE